MWKKCSKTKLLEIMTWIRAERELRKTGWEKMMILFKTMKSKNLNCLKAHIKGPKKDKTIIIVIKEKEGDQGDQNVWLHNLTRRNLNNTKIIKVSKREMVTINKIANKNNHISLDIIIFVQEITIQIKETVQVKSQENLI